MPWDIVAELKGAGATVKELTPAMLRSLLRSPTVNTALAALTTQVDLLEYCCSDIRKEAEEETSTGSAPSAQEQSTSGPHGGSSLADRIDMMPLPPEVRAVLRSRMPGQAGTSDARTGAGAGSASQTRPAGAGAAGSRDDLDSLADLMVQLGRSVVDIGRTALEEIEAGGSSGSAGRGSGSSNASSTAPRGFMGLPLTAAAAAAAAAAAVSGGVGGVGRAPGAGQGRSGATDGAGLLSSEEDASSPVEPFPVDAAKVAELRQVPVPTGAAATASAASHSLSHPHSLSSSSTSVRGNSLEAMQRRQQASSGAPTSSSLIARLGQHTLIIASPRQQRLLPSLSPRFVHASCVARPSLSALFHHPRFCSSLRLEPFTERHLADGLISILPRASSPSSAVMALWERGKRFAYLKPSAAQAEEATSPVGREASSAANHQRDRAAAMSEILVMLTPARQGPHDLDSAAVEPLSMEWLCELWQEIGMSEGSGERLVVTSSLFDDRYLVPAMSREGPVLVKVSSRRIVFVPPLSDAPPPQPSATWTPTNSRMHAQIAEAGAATSEATERAGQVSAEAAAITAAFRDDHSGASTGATASSASSNSGSSGRDSSPPLALQPVDLRGKPLPPSSLPASAQQLLWGHERLQATWPWLMATLRNKFDVPLFDMRFAACCGDDSAGGSSSGSGSGSASGSGSSSRGVGSSAGGRGGGNGSGSGSGGLGSAMGSEGGGSRGRGGLAQLCSDSNREAAARGLQALVLATVAARKVGAGPGGISFRTTLSSFRATLSSFRTCFHRFAPYFHRFAPHFHRFAHAFIVSRHTFIVSRHTFIVSRHTSVVSHHAFIVLHHTFIVLHMLSSFRTILSSFCTMLSAQNQSQSSI